MHTYYIIYKPYLAVSQFSPLDGKKTLADYFSLPKDVYPVGRLDHDSEGLLLLTNDTALNSLLLHPVNKHNRTYWVQVEGNISQSAIGRLEKGIKISIDGKPHKTLPASVHIIEEPKLPPRNPPIRVRQTVPTSWISITLTEGKNRQVRRMTAAAGYPTLRLVRYSIEDISLETLENGTMLELSKKETYRLLRLANI